MQVAAQIVGGFDAGSTALEDRLVERCRREQAAT